MRYVNRDRIKFCYNDHLKEGEIFQELADGSYMVSGYDNGPAIYHITAADIAGYAEKELKSSCREGEKDAEPAEEDLAEYKSGYNNGIDDLVSAMKVYYPLNSKERLDHFGRNGQTVRYATEDPKDLICMAKAYEEAKRAEEEIKVGDEVEVNNTYKAVVTQIRCIDGKEYAYVLFHDGSTGNRKVESLKKTGNYFDEVAKLLSELDK